MWVRGLQAGADTVVPGPGPTPAATAEESEKILRWLESDGVRLVHVDGEWTCPVGGATKHLRCTTPSSSRAPPWCPSTSAARCARCTNRSASVTP